MNRSCLSTEGGLLRGCYGAAGAAALRVEMGGAFTSGVCRGFIVV